MWWFRALWLSESSQKQFLKGMVIVWGHGTGKAKQSQVLQNEQTTRRWDCWSSLSGGSQAGVSWYRQWKEHWASTWPISPLDGWGCSEHSSYHSHPVLSIRVSLPNISPVLPSLTSTPSPLGACSQSVLFTGTSTLHLTISCLSVCSEPGHWASPWALRKHRSRDPKQHVNKDSCFTESGEGSAWLCQLLPSWHQIILSMLKTYNIWSYLSLICSSVQCVKFIHIMQQTPAWVTLQAILNCILIGSVSECFFFFYLIFIGV